jgi:very-short-patch-repair endonuclease
MWHLLAQLWPLLLVVLLLLLLLHLGRILLPEEEQPPYEKRPSLLTQSERRFFGVLQEAAGSEWEIFAMVRLADLIRVRSEAPQFQSWQNRIHAKHIDFVLCDPETLEARLAVELDDVTHQRADRRQRDAFVESALSVSRLPLLRVPVATDYDPRQLKRSLHEALRRP